MTDLIGGHADVSFQNLGAASAHVKSGKLKILAVTGEKRDAAFPNTPTMAETGVQDLEVYSWQAFTAPKGLPKDVTAKLQPAITAILNEPQIKQRLADIGFEVVANSPAQFETFLKAELARWKGVVDAGNIKAE